MKKLFGLLLIAVAFTVSLSAQKSVSGTVVDDTGLPVIGASVIVDGLDIGTITDIDGTYQLTVPDGSNRVIISYTGYGTQEIDVTSGSVFDVVLAEGALLDEIVVTGLGIKKEKKALGYGVSTISTAQIGNRVESDVSRVLRGKTTGVDITSTSGLAGSGTSIIIRGYSSISGDNQPLFVVDGVPFNTQTNTEGSNFSSGSASASYRFLDLDPNNIAEINILKGLSATVLYGEQGRNGVVLVTTKTGSFDDDIDQGFEITVNQSLSSTSVANIPEYQNTFGNGFSGSFGWFFSNWGPAFDNLDPNFYGGSFEGVVDGVVQLTHPYLTGRGFADQHPSVEFGNYEYRPFESAEDFFDRGFSSNTSVNISKNLGNGAQINAAYGFIDEDGFTPDLADGSASNNYRKHNLSLGATAKLANNLKVDARLNYVTSGRVTPPASPGFGSGTFVAGVASLFSDVLYTPRSIDLFGLPFQSELDGSQTYYRQTSQITHPLWTLNNTRDSEDVDRVFGNANLTYDITDNIFLQTRFSVDQYTQTNLSLIHISEPTRRYAISYAVFCLKKKK